MFNPQNNVDTSKIWGSLGTFYNKLDLDSKLIVQQFWSALLNGLEGLYYDLTQVNLSDDFTGPGYIEDAYIDLPVNTNTLIRFDTGNYGLYLENNYYAIPTLSGQYTGTTFTQGMEYTISGLNTIVFTDVDALRTVLFDDTINFELGYNYTISGLDTFLFETTDDREAFTALLNDTNYYNKVDFTVSGLQVQFTNLNALQYITGYETETFIAKTALRVPPIVTDLYIKYFDRERKSNPVQTLLSEEYYEPYLKQWYTYTGLNRSRLYAAHIFRWLHNLSVTMLKGPSVLNIEKALKLLRNVPFSYTAGEVTDITISGLYNVIKIRGDQTYDSQFWFEQEPYLRTEETKQIVELEPALPAEYDSITLNSYEDEATISGIYTYWIPRELGLLYEVGDEVDKFAFLCSGLSVFDYVNNPTGISGLIDWNSNPESYYSNLLIQSDDYLNQLRSYTPFYDSYLNYQLPGGLTINHSYLSSLGDGLSFNGINQYLISSGAGSAYNSPTALTIGLWILKTEHGPATGNLAEGLINRGTTAGGGDPWSYILWLKRDGDKYKIRFHACDNAAASGTKYSVESADSPIELGKPYFITVKVIKNEYPELRVNGQWVNRTDLGKYNSDIYSSSSSLYVGYKILFQTGDNILKVDNPFYGLIDGVFVSNVAFTDAEILQAYNGGRGVNMTQHARANDLIAYLRLNQNTTDESPVAQDFTKVNYTESGYQTGIVRDV